MINIGAHLSITKGFASAAKTAIDIGGNTFQYFPRNPRGGSVKALDLEDVQKFREIMEENGFAPVLCHAPYTYNLCSASEDTRTFARTALREDLERLEMIPVHLYNFHPGSHVGQGVEKGIEQIAEILNEVVTEEITTYVLLETMSGKGSEVGSKFEELRSIIDKVKYNERIGVCMDTCHVFSAGYDIVNDLDGVLDEFDRIVGLDRLKAIHLNDSMKPFGDKKDRHAELGKGEIGMDALLRFITHPKLKDLPFFLETPLEDDGHKEEIKMLKKILANR